MHGGGFVLGDLDTSEAVCSALVEEANCLVASVDYRLAPEHPFPPQRRTASPRCGGLRNTSRRTAATRPTSPSGATARAAPSPRLTALQACDQNGPELAHQLLVYPITAGERSLPSRRENAWNCGLTTKRCGGSSTATRLTRSTVLTRTRIRYRAGTLSNLPPATVCTAEFDPLRDDGRRIRGATPRRRVPTTAYHYDDAIHGFLSMVSEPDVEPAREALSDANAALRDTFDE